MAADIVNFYYPAARIMTLYYQAAKIVIFHYLAARRALRRGPRLLATRMVTFCYLGVRMIHSTT